MKYTLQSYFETLQRCAISEKNYHRWYTRTVEYANELRNIICAEDESKKELLQQFSRRESDEEFKRSLDFTHILSRPIAERIFAPVNKGAKNDQITTEVKFKNESDGKDTKERISKFYGDKSLYQYCLEYPLSVVRHDPNAFVLIQFKDFNPNVEKPKPEAIIIPSSGAVHYMYENGTLDYLVVYSERFGNYTLYLEDYNVRLTQVDASKYSNVQVGTISDEKLYEIEKLNKSQVGFVKLAEKVYKYEFTDQVKAGRVQAERIGHILDPWTGGETCVSLLHPAVPRIKRMLQKSRNLSLNLDFHTFNQKIQVQPLCNGYENDTCSGGKNINGETCKRCGGSSYEPIHESPTDVIIVPLAKNGQEQIDLGNIAKYIQPETESTKLLWEFEQQNETAAFSDVYTQNSFTQSAVQKTATEITVSYDSIHDKVRPEFASGLRNIFKFCVQMIATFLDEYNKVESIDLKVPADLQLYTLQDLITQYKSAIDSNSPIQVRQKIRDQILKMLHQDDDAQKKRDAAMLIHEPFSDKSKEEVQFGASNNWIRKRDVILSMNYEMIMTQVFMENGEAFFTMNYEVQKEKINSVLNVLIKEIEGERTVTVPL